MVMIVVDKVDMEAVVAMAVVKAATVVKVVVSSR